MSERDADLLLYDILECGEKILSFTKNVTFDEFTANVMLTDAVLRNFEVIGEAAGRLPNELKQQYNNINWRQIRGFRNRLVHGYFGINYQTVWFTKNELLPELLTAVRIILNKLEK